jgi:formylglycine-generating enzyme required for sulfatase activity
VGKKKPNDLGLFDMHGNVYTWCQERFQSHYPASKNGESIEDKDGELSITTTGRVLRGGSFYDQASAVRSADRNRLVPTYHAFHVGFRPARTFTP